jgi:hypothetical protein
MSMIYYVEALSTEQMAAFQSDPSLASGRAETAARDELEVGRAAKMSPEMLAEFRAAQAQLAQQVPGAREQETMLSGMRAKLAKFAPFDPCLRLDKTWHILHYLLTGHADAAAAPGNFLLSGEPLGADLGYGPARLQDVASTRAFRDFMAPLTSDRLVERMDWVRMAKLRIYPLTAPPDAANAASWRSEVAAAFDSLKAYVGQACGAGKGALTWLS